MPRPLSLKKRSPGEVVETETPIFNQNSLQKIDSSPSPEKPQFLTAETPTLKMKKLTDQFRAALVLHQDKQDYDQEASLKFKSLMYELIANKHKKIIENPQMEKKDGVQEFLDQKKKLGSSVFRSTKNINQTVLTDGQNGLKRRFTLNKSNSGEKLDEMLISHHESQLSFCYDENYFLTLPAGYNQTLATRYQSHAAFPYAEFSSVTKIMNKTQIKEMLKKGKFI